MATHSPASAKRFVESSTLPEEHKANLKVRLANGESPDIIVEEVRRVEKGVSYRTKQQGIPNTR